MNDFRRDDRWQKGIRDSILIPQFYRKCAADGRYVLLDKGRLADLLQRRMAVDTLVQGKEGGVVAIEEKIVRWPRSGRPYTAFCLETHSCTRPGHESDGWMVYGEADYLLYGFVQANGGMIAYLIDFPELCEWFWPNINSFNVFQMEHTLNRTRGRLVDIEDVRRNVRMWRYELEPPEPCEAAA